MKEYILILDSTPDEFVPVICAHASLVAHLKWSGVSRLYGEWLDTSFKKCVVSVNAREFYKAKEFADIVVITESALEGKEVAIVLCPRMTYPKAVRFYKLWKPKNEKT